MCESNAYLKKGAKSELFLKDVTLLEPLGEGRWLVENLLGERREFSGAIERIDFLNHKILLKPAK